MPECLQWNGLHARHDSAPSGFGPYSQVRICKETGGVFFLLPGEEEDLVGKPAAIEAREFEALAMKEYEPLLLARKEYITQRERSDFRKGCWAVIAGLNPHMDHELSLRTWHFSIEPAEFAEEGKREFTKGVRAMGKLEEAIALLEKIKPLRAKEDSSRWRAAYDLMYAQCVAYRARMFQYLLALDDHAAKSPKPSDPKHNRWDIHWVRDEQEPTDDQFEKIKSAFKLKVDKSGYLAMLDAERQKATNMFNETAKEHPGTPWAARAKWDRDRGYGFKFHSSFHDPRYEEVGKRIKVPKF